VAAGVEQRGEKKMEGKKLGGGRSARLAPTKEEGVRGSGAAGQVARRGGGDPAGAGPGCAVGHSGSERGENRGHVGRPGERKIDQAQRNSKIFNLFKKISNEYELFWSKSEPTRLQKFQINYVFEENQIRNKFPYRYFSKFRVEFELKFEEALGFKIQSNLVEFEWNFPELEEFNWGSPDFT
jgi:hypothetical protein